MTTRLIWLALFLILVRLGFEGSTATTAAVRVNVAAAAQGATASASSEYSSGYAASAVINGDRRGTAYGSAGVWHDATSVVYPDWIEIAFAGSKTIDEVAVFTVQDAWSAPSEPTSAMTWSQWGVNDFTVQYWTGSAWQAVPGGVIVDNNLVWRSIAFAPLTTTRIRVVVQRARDGWSRLTEVEAWGSDDGTGNPPAAGLNVAAAAEGATISASSAYSSMYPAAALINGERRGGEYGGGGVWHDATSGVYPDTVDITFAGSRTIDQVAVFTVQDAWNAPSEPTPGMTWSRWGVADFTVQYWTGSSWQTLPGGTIVNNNLVWRAITFTPVTTTMIRVVVQRAADGWSRLTEIEAYQSGGGTPGNTPPSVAITAPAEGASAVAPASFTVSAAASDAEGAVSSVAFYQNGTLIAQDGSSPFGVPWNNVGAGAYTLTAVATDGAGITTTSAPVHVTVTGSGLARINVAAAAQGATAAASSGYSAGYPAAAVINGDRRGLNYGSGGVWHDATSGAYPDSVAITFAGGKTIDEVAVFTVQDAWNAPGEPTQGMTWSQWGVNDFTVQYWTGSAWQTVPGGVIVNNNLVWRAITFTPITTTAIRVLIQRGADGWSRLTEIEAFGVGSGGGPGPSVSEWFVAAGANGDGSTGNPFGSIQDGLNAAQPGDVVTVRPGTYNESIATIRGGSAGQPILLRSEAGRGSVLVTNPGRVLTVSHPYFTFEGLVFDGQYGADDLVRVTTAGNYLHVKNNELRRSSRDLVDMHSPTGVLIEGSLLHHALNPVNGRADAHGIVGTAVRDLTVRDTEIHTFSGSGIQVDPARSVPGWDNVLIERTRIWLEPLPVSINGYPAGLAPGENAVATKASESAQRARLTIRDLTAWGYRNGPIPNMAALNLKENIDAVVDGATIFDSDIAFRLRGPGPFGSAWIRVQNAVVYDTLRAFRYEDNIENLRIWNNTVGSGVPIAFQPGDSTSAGLDVRNLLVLGPLPVEAAAVSNLAVTASAFTNVGTHDYSLAPGSPAIDAGVTISGVSTDRAGVTRPRGAAFDVGAFERP
jgi:hypothetical protein